MLPSEQQQFERAMTFYAAGDLGASETAFTPLVNVTELRAQALAAIGLIRIQQKRCTDASALFEESLGVEATATAHYGLGVIAEDTGRNGDALIHFQSAIGLDTTHEAARGRAQRLLKQLNAATLAPEPPRPAAAEPLARPVAEPPSSRKAERSRSAVERDVTPFMQLLSDDASASSPTSAMSRDALTFFRKVDSEMRPQKRAFPFTFITAWLLLAMIATAMAAGLSYLLLHRQ